MSIVLQQCTGWKLAGIFSPRECLLAKRMTLHQSRVDPLPCTPCKHPFFLAVYSTLICIAHSLPCFFWKHFMSVFAMSCTNQSREWIHVVLDLRLSTNDCPGPVRRAQNDAYAYEYYLNNSVILGPGFGDSGRGSIARSAHTTNPFHSHQYFIIALSYNPRCILPHATTHNHVILCPCQHDIQILHSVGLLDDMRHLTSAPDWRQTGEWMHLLIICASHGLGSLEPCIMACKYGQRAYIWNACLR